MTLTQLRIVQIREALESDDKPSTYAQLEKYVEIHKTHIARLVTQHFDLYKSLMRNKEEKRRAKLIKDKELIEAHMKEHGTSAQYASVAVGFDGSRYSQIKRELKGA